MLGAKRRIVDDFQSHLQSLTGQSDIAGTRGSDEFVDSSGCLHLVELGVEERDIRARQAGNDPSPERVRGDRNRLETSKLSCEQSCRTDDDTVGKGRIVQQRDRAPEGPFGRLEPVLPDQRNRERLQPEPELLERIGDGSNAAPHTCPGELTPLSLEQGDRLGDMDASTLETGLRRVGSHPRDGQQMTADENELLATSNEASTLVDHQQALRQHADDDVRLTARQLDDLDTVRGNARSAGSCSLDRKPTDSARRANGHDPQTLAHAGTTCFAGRAG